MAALFEVLSQFLVVIDLAIKDKPFGTVGAVYRLMAARDVDDRQAAHGQANVLADIKAIFVRAAMHDGLVHRFEGRAINRVAIGINESGNSAHLVISKAAGPRGGCYRRAFGSPRA